MSAAATDTNLMQAAHVLFMDMVGYSLLSPGDQSRRVATMQEVVQATEAFRTASAGRELLVLPSGDGMGLAFLRDPMAPVRCAVELATELRQHPEVLLRMGIHTGMLALLPDFVGHPTAAGPVLNDAQRVMACGDAGHILLSEAAVAHFARAELPQANLEDLGPTCVKFGKRLRVFNLWGPGFGNATLPAQFEAIWIPSSSDDTAIEFAPPDDGAPGEPHLPPKGGPQIPVGRADLDPPGGPVPLQSKYYIARQSDALFLSALRQRDSILLLKGPRQAGKTSLLARGVAEARRQGTRVVLTDFQKLGQADFTEPERLFRALADQVANQLGLEDPFTAWKPYRGPGVNFETFLRRQVLANKEVCLLWALDEVDRLFGCPFASEVFGLFRSWHNGRALEPEGPWLRLTLAMAHATEAHLFIADLNQSPFNVGTRLSMQDFTLEEVGELNRRYGSPLRTKTGLARLYRLFGGHPFLVRNGLDQLAVGHWMADDLERQSLAEEGLVGEHLDRLWRFVEADAALRDDLRSVLRGRPAPTDLGFYRLRSAGLLAGDSPATARPRCQLYALFLGHKLR